ncbi:MAG: LamG-like jellyroll fold domain-containing protein [Kofleriaceae bacterium]
MATLGLTACVDEGDEFDDLIWDSQEVALPPPTNLTVTVISSVRMDLDWDDSPGATKYVVMRGFSPGTETSYTTTPLNPSSFAAGHLTPNTQYCWQVRNVNATNEVSAPSNEVCATTDPDGAVAPANVVATAISSSRIVVTWDAVPTATKYYIYRALGAGVPSIVGSVLAPTTSFTSAGLAAGTTYSFTVAAVTPSGTSPQSTPPAFATTFANGLEAYYKFDEDAGATTNDSSGFNRHGTLVGGAAFSNDKSPVIDNPSTMSLPAGTTSGVTLPAAVPFRLTSPTSIALWVKLATADTNYRILGMRNAGCGSLGWELGQDGANGLYFASSGGTRSFGVSLPVGEWTHVAFTYNTPTAIQMYVDGVLTASHSLVVGNNLALPLTVGHAGGCAGGDVLVDELRVFSRILSPAEVATFGTLPPAPATLSAMAVSSTRQDIAWSAVAGASKYLIYRGTAPGSQSFLTSIGAGFTTYANGHLMPSTLYSWTIRTVANGLISDPSPEAVATTFAGPSAPTGVTAMAVSTSRINVAWNAVSGAAKYYVYQSINGGAYALKGSVVSPTVTLGATGLASGTNHCYVVRAEDSGFTVSPDSAPPACATTL